MEKMKFKARSEEPQRSTIKHTLTSSQGRRTEDMGEPITLWTERSSVYIYTQNEGRWFR